MPKLNPITGSWPLPTRRRGSGQEGPFVYDIGQECPNCGWVDMRFALGIQELPDDDPLIEVTKRSAEEDGKSVENVPLWEVYARPGPAVRSPRPATNRAGAARFVERDFQLERRADELIGHHEARRCHGDRAAGPVLCDGERSLRGQPNGGRTVAKRNGRSRMLKLTIELVPGGFEPMRRTIASMRISNMSNLADCSDYCIAAMEAANALTGEPARNAKCMVLAHDRRQSVWALLEKACHEIIEANYNDQH
jgi:hypothetical protein